MCLETNNIIKKMECLKLDIVADSQQRKQEEEHEHQHQHQHQQEQEEQHFHVLAVDDNLIERKLLEKLLKVSSYKVTCVHSGDEALKYLGLHDDLDQNSPPSSSFSSPSPILEGSKVNLIMTDYCMPGISGYDLLKRVKGSSWKDVPVVIMSSENVPSRISKCLEGGAEEFLLKPLQLSDLKNLEHYLLKPTPTMDDDFSASDDSNNEDDTKTDDTEDNKSNNNNMISKRKAASPGPSERLPKVKGVAVV